MRTHNYGENKGENNILIKYKSKAKAQNGVRI